MTDEEFESLPEEHRTLVNEYGEADYAVAVRAFGKDADTLARVLAANRKLREQRRLLGLDRN